MLKRSLIAWGLLSPLILITLFPFAVMLTTALKPREEVFAFPPRWLPSRLAWENFADMWQATNMGRAVVNSLTVSALATALALAVGIPAAYALSRQHFPGKGGYRQFLLITQMLSPIVLVVGLFRLIAALGLIDSLTSLVLIYAAFNTAFTVWMLQSYFATIPRDIEEAAWIDGAGRLASLVRIFLPLALPAMGVTALFAFINGWNEFVVALTMLRSADTYTLPIQVFSLVGGRYTIEWHHVMAATLVATLPVAVLFAWLQRYLVQGLSVGAVK